MPRFAHRISPLQLLNGAALLGAATVVFGQAAQIGFAPTDLAGAPFEFETAEQDGIRVELVARGFGRAFSLAFLPNGDALISERGVGLRLVRDATGQRGATALVEAPVTGGPPRGTGRGGGMHEVVAHPDFAANNLVYYTYNAAGDAPAGGQPTYALTLARSRYADGALTG
jgi:glucose/arabinose dehydrogenase